MHLRVHPSEVRGRSPASGQTSTFERCFIIGASKFKLPDLQRLNNSVRLPVTERKYISSPSFEQFQMDVMVFITM